MQTNVPENSPSLSVGMYLRQLRQEREISLDELSGACGITYRTLQKIESGKTKLPRREILFVVLRELSGIKKMNAVERKKILEPFGYCDQSALPTEDEIQRIVRQWETSVKELPHPACLVDFAHRIHAWNHYAPKMMGLSYGHPALELARGKTLFDLIFHPQFSSSFGLGNKETFISEMLETMRSEFEPFKDEDWCKDCIAHAYNSYPDFRESWNKVLAKPVRELGLRMIGPILMNPDGSTPLSFYLLGTDFLNDSRFRVIQYLPANAETMRQCLSWIEEDQRA